MNTNVFSITEFEESEFRKRMTEKFRFLEKWILQESESVNEQLSKFAIVMGDIRLYLEGKVLQRKLLIESEEIFVNNADLDVIELNTSYLLCIIKDESKKRTSIENIINAIVEFNRSYLKAKELLEYESKNMSTFTDARLVNRMKATFSIIENSKMKVDNILRDINMDSYIDYVEST